MYPRKSWIWTDVLVIHQLAMVLTTTARVVHHCDAVLQVFFWWIELKHLSSTIVSPYSSMHGLLSSRTGHVKIHRVRSCTHNRQGFPKLLSKVLGGVSGFVYHHHKVKTRVMPWTDIRSRHSRWVAHAICFLPMWVQAIQSKPRRKKKMGFFSAGYLETLKAWSTFHDNSPP